MSFISGELVLYLDLEFWHDTHSGNASTAVQYGEKGFMEHMSTGKGRAGQWRSLDLGLQFYTPRWLSLVKPHREYKYLIQSASLTAPFRLPLQKLLSFGISQRRS